MARNQVMKLWTAIVTAFLALCTVLGLVTATAETAVAQAEPTRNSNENASVVHATLPTVSYWAWSQARSLPPTMKQRIHAEAHGSSPGCRQRSVTDTEPTTHLAPACDTTPVATAPTPHLLL